MTALYIVITVVKYVGQDVAVPALLEKATCASFSLFETISVLMASVVLSLFRFMMVIAGQGMEAVVRYALPASPSQVVIYKGLC